MDKKKFRLLIVDDISRNIQVLANILREKGYQIAFARSGRAALEKMQARNFDLILLDIMMPEIDGFEVCKRLKAYPETKDIPIIFLTAKTDTKSIVRGFELGAIDYVTKPFNKMELLARVRTHLTLRQSQKDLRASEQRLQEAVAAKDKFFSIIAHDLRGPFYSLFHLYEFMEDDIDMFDRNQLIDFFKSLRESAKRTFNLLENLLNWARTQTGSVHFSPEFLNLSSLIRNVAKLIESGADDKNISLKLDIDEKTDVYADKNMLRTILQNLIANAVKFTPRGGTITIHTQEKGDCIEITVADTGVGISQGNMEKLFRIDAQFTTFGTEEEKGSGLGLILCKEFAGANGGQIWVESEMGKGSSFRFTLPRENK